MLTQTRHANEKTWAHCQSPYWSLSGGGTGARAAGLDDGAAYSTAD